MESPASKSVFDELNFADKSFSSASYANYQEELQSSANNDGPSLVEGSPSTSIDYYEQFVNNDIDLPSTPELSGSPLSSEKAPLTQSPLSNIAAFKRIINSSKERRGSGVIMPQKSKNIPISPKTETTTRYTKQLPSTPTDVGTIRANIGGMSKEDLIENIKKFEEEEKKTESLTDLISKVEAEIDALSLTNGSSNTHTSVSSLGFDLSLDPPEDLINGLEATTDPQQIIEPKQSPIISNLKSNEPVAISINVQNAGGDTQKDFQTSTTVPLSPRNNTAAQEGPSSSLVNYFGNNSNSKDKRHTMYVDLFKKNSQPQYPMSEDMSRKVSASILERPHNTSRNVPLLPGLANNNSTDILATPRHIIKLHLPYDQSQVVKVEPLMTMRDLIVKTIRTRLPNCTIETLTISYMNKEPIDLDTLLTHLRADDVVVAIKSKKTAEIENGMDVSLLDTLLKLQQLINQMVKILSNLKNVYMAELKGDKQKVISQKKFNALFFGIEPIHLLNFTFSTKLNAKLSELSFTGLRSLFFLLEGCIPLYIAYASNFPQAMAVLRKLQTKPKFVSAVEGIRSRLATTETLSDLLSFTLQNIPKLQLVTESLERLLIKQGDASGDLEAISSFLAKLPQIPLKNITALEGGSGKKTPRKK